MNSIHASSGRGPESTMQASTPFSSTVHQGGGGGGGASYPVPNSALLSRWGGKGRGGAGTVVTVLGFAGCEGQTNL